MSSCDITRPQCVNCTSDKKNIHLLFGVFFPLGLGDRVADLALDLALPVRALPAPDLALPGFDLALPGFDLALPGLEAGADCLDSSWIQKVIVLNHKVI